MNKNDRLKKKDKKKDMGFRFLLFRKAMGKSVRELAAEVNVHEAVITGIEDGNAYPEITFLHLLHVKYGLNINWLLTDNGHMFAKKNRSRKTSENKNYAEMFDLMRIPAVEEAIQAALTEIRALLELERRREMGDENGE